MSQNPAIGLVMATMLEATPFISGLKLEESEAVPFPIYGNDHLRLIITGVGKANAAMACSYFIYRCNTGIICNLGAAGATDSDFALGDCRQIEKMIEPDRLDLATGLFVEHKPEVLEGFLSVSLATQDKPVREAAKRKEIARFARLVDMEGAAVVQTCRNFDKPCYTFKFVSDTPVHGQSRDIRNNVSLYREDFYRFFREKVLPRLCANVEKNKGSK